MHFDAEAKVEPHSEAAKLLARYDSPLKTVKALRGTTVSLRLGFLAKAHRHPGIGSFGYDDTRPAPG